MDFEKEAKWMMWIIMGPPILGTLFVFVFGILLRPIDFRFLISLIIQLTGAYFIYKSKARSIQAGDYTTFGTKNMSSAEVSKYKFGYLLFVVGLVIAAALAIS